MAKLEPLAMFGLLEMMHDSGHDFWAHRKQKKKREMDCQKIPFCPVKNQWLGVFSQISHDS